MWNWDIWWNQSVILLLIAFETTCFGKKIPFFVCHGITNVIGGVFEILFSLSIWYLLSDRNIFQPQQTFFLRMYTTPAIFLCKIWKNVYMHFYFYMTSCLKGNMVFTNRSSSTFQRYQRQIKQRWRMLWLFTSEIFIEYKKFTGYIQ